MSRVASFGQVMKFSAKHVHKQRNNEVAQNSGPNMQCQTLFFGRELGFASSLLCRTIHGG